MSKKDAGSRDSGSDKRGKRDEQEEYPPFTDWRPPKRTKKEHDTNKVVWGFLTHHQGKYRGGPKPKGQ